MSLFIDLNQRGFLFLMKKLFHLYMGKKIFYIISKLHISYHTSDREQSVVLKSTRYGPEDLLLNVRTTMY